MISPEDVALSIQPAISLFEWMVNSVRKEGHWLITEPFGYVFIEVEAFFKDLNKRKSHGVRA